MTTDKEVKARFFAQYWGQKVFMCPDWEVFNDNKPNRICEAYLVPNSHWLNKGYLQLRSLSSISDEDAIEVAKAEFSFFKDCSGFEIKVVRELSRISVAAVSDKTCLAKIEVNNPYKLNLMGVDYLRSKGYALPFQDMTVEDLVSQGWVTVKLN